MASERKEGPIGQTGGVGAFTAEVACAEERYSGRGID